MPKSIDVLILKSVLWSGIHNDAILPFGDHFIAGNKMNKMNTKLKVSHVLHVLA